MNFSSFSEYLQSLETRGPLPAGGRKRLLSAAARLQELIGPTWLKALQRDNCLTENWFSNHADWSYGRFVWLADFLSGLDNALRTPLANLLRSSERYREAYYLILETFWWQQRGFLVEREPILMEFPAKPDLRVSSVSSTYLVESTEMHESDSTEQMRDFFSELTSNLPVPMLLITLRLNRLPEDDERRALLDSVRSTIDEAFQFGSVRVLEDERISLLAGPRQMLAETQAWHTEHGLKPGDLVSGIQHSESVERTLRKLEKKLRQLPTTQAGVLHIFTHSMLWFHKTEELSGALITFLQQNPQVSFVMISGDEFSADGNELVWGEGWAWQADSLSENWRLRRWVFFHPEQAHRIQGLLSGMRK